MIPKEHEDPGEPAPSLSPLRGEEAPGPSGLRLGSADPQKPWACGSQGPLAMALGGPAWPWGIHPQTGLQFLDVWNLASTSGQEEAGEDRLRSAQPTTAPSRGLQGPRGSGSVQKAWTVEGHGGKCARSRPAHRGASKARVRQGRGAERTPRSPEEVRTGKMLWPAPTGREPEAEWRLSFGSLGRAGTANRHKSTWQRGRAGREGQGRNPFSIRQAGRPGDEGQVQSGRRGRGRGPGRAGGRAMGRTPKEMQQP